MNSTTPINWPEHQQQHRLAELEMSKQLFELARQQIGRSLGRHFDRAPSRELVRIVELASQLGRRATALDDQNTDLRQLLDEADQKFYDDIRRVYASHGLEEKAQDANTITAPQTPEGQAPSSPQLQPQPPEQQPAPAEAPDTRQLPHSPITGATESATETSSLGAACIANPPTPPRLDIPEG